MKEETEHAALRGLEGRIRLFPLLIAVASKSPTEILSVKRAHMEVRSLGLPDTLHEGAVLERPGRKHDEKMPSEALVLL